MRHLKALIGIVLSLLLISCASESKKPLPPAPDKKSDEAIIAYGVQTEIEEAPDEEMNELALEKQLQKALEKNQYDEIKVISAKLLSRDESNVVALNSLGVVNFREKKYGIASIFWNRVIQKDPENSSALNNLGVIALNEDRDSDAIVMFKKAIRYNSDNTAASSNLGSLYLKYYNFKAAEASLDIAKSDFKKDPYFLSNYAVALQGNSSSGAISKMEDAVDANKKNVNLAMNYASMLIYAEKELTKAEKILTQVKLLTQDPKDLVRLSKIQRNLDAVIARKRQKENSKRSKK